jgi:hypothetical protein
MHLLAHPDQQCNQEGSHGSNPPRLQPNPTITSNANNLLDDNNALPDHIDEGLTNLVFMVIHNITGLVFSNQTGCFPITFNRGHEHLVIFYIYDANFILSVQIKNQTKQELLHAYQITYKYLSSCGFKPRLHKMDNKTSKDVKTSSNPNKLHSHTLLWTSIAPTPPNKLFALGRITSPQVLPDYQNLSPLPTGVASPINVTTQSTCFVPVAIIPSSPLLRPWKAPPHLMLHPWSLLAPKFSYTSNQLVASLEVFMPPTVGTSDHH